MANYCYNCGHLDPKNKSEGHASGGLYYCKKHKTYVNAATNTCGDWKYGYRGSYQDDQIYRDSNYYSDDTMPMWVYVVLLIALIVLGIILGAFDL